MMRSAGNFSPEWGYLAPAPSILRTVRVVLVATAVGATAGAGVVLSLIDHSASDGERVSAAAHAIVTSAQAAPVAVMAAPAAPVANAAPVAAAMPAVSDAKFAPANVAAAPPAQTPAQNSVQPGPQIQAAAPVTSQPDNTAQQFAAKSIAPAQQAVNTPGDGTKDTGAVSPPPQPSVAALSDAAVTAAPAETSDATGSDQTTPLPQKKNKHRTTTAYGRDNGPNLGLALRHLFSARASTSYYPNRGL
jgi:ribonuclease E